MGLDTWPLQDGAGSPSAFAQASFTAWQQRATSKRFPVRCDEKYIRFANTVKRNFEWRRIVVTEFESGLDFRAANFNYFGGFSLKAPPKQKKAPCEAMILHENPIPTDGWPRAPKCGQCPEQPPGRKPFHGLSARE